MNTTLSEFEDNVHTPTLLTLCACAALWRVVMNGKLAHPCRAAPIFDDSAQTVDEMPGDRRLLLRIQVLYCAQLLVSEVQKPVDALHKSAAV